MIRQKVELRLFLFVRGKNMSYNERGDMNEFYDRMLGGSFDLLGFEEVQ